MAILGNPGQVGARRSMLGDKKVASMLRHGKRVGWPLKQLCTRRKVCCLAGEGRWGFGTCTSSL
eukprot:5814071-Amphidinium_carterae.1